MLVLLLITAGRASAQQTDPLSRDVIYFKNGDMLQGEIKSLLMGELTFSADEVNNDVTVKLKDIRMMRARRMIYEVEDVNSRKYYGIIDSSRFPGWVSVYREKDTVDIYLQDIDNIRVLDDDLWKRMDGSISLGFSYSRSSQVGRINGGGDVSYNTRRWILKLNSDLMYTIDETYKGIEKADLSMQGYYEFRRRWFSVGQIQYQRITELNVDARIQGIVGVGPTVVKTRHQDLRVASGISIQQEFGSDSSGGRESNVNTEIPLIVNYYLVRFGHPELSLQATNNFFFSLSEKGRWRVDQNATFAWKIIRHLNLSLQIYLNYDSQPIGSTTGAVDYGTVFSIGYSF